MSTTAEVRLWGRTIAAVSLGDGDEVAAFEYDPAFLKSGIQISPLMMPLSNQIFTFPELSRQTFYGLPGLLADSLPDKFGNALIDAWLATQGRGPGEFNAVERLCYTGARGMGALEFSPTIGPKTRQAKPVQIDKLVELASAILSHRNHFQTSLDDENKAQGLSDILKVGTSAGGARAKAVIAWNPYTNEVRSGQISAGEGFEYWLLKFDGVSGNRDKELEDPQGYGLIEYAYSLMAQDCGIEISPCRLFEENGRQLRRMVFNIVARNQDDHVKNIAFLMDKAGQWSLAPAFDMTYSFNPSGSWTAHHQMTMNGKRDDFTLDGFKTCAKTASMKRGRAESIVREVQETVARWKDYAKAAGVPSATQNQIQQTLRLKDF